MNLHNKATAIRLSDFHSAPMRAFHMTWLAFFLCFFGWFGIAPLMPVVAGAAIACGWTLWRTSGN